MIKTLYIYTLILFFNCASQAPPSGGPIDITGPVLLEIYPENTSDINEDQSITLSFDEDINPNSIVNAIFINPLLEVSVKVRGSRVIIKPLNNWPTEFPIEINLDRNISDFKANKINQQIQLIYNIKNKNYGSISGSLINSSSNTHNIYLYNWPIDDISKPIKKVNSDANNNFIIKYLKPQKYVLVSSDGNLNIYQNRYGICPYEYVELDSIDFNKDISIYMDDALEQLNISRVEAVNSNLINIFYNNNSTMPYVLEPLVNDGDSIYINITKNNRLHHYEVAPYLYIGKTYLDTISPNITSVDKLDSSIVINFSEPINSDSLIVLGLDNSSSDIDQNWKLVDFENINLMVAKLEDSNLQAIKISGHNVQDLSQNKMLDSIKVYTFNNRSTDSFGSMLRGKVISASNQNIIVEAQNISLDLSHHSRVENSLFVFENLQPGKYVFRVYEQKNTINPLIYFSGTLNPYQSAAPFSIHKDTVEVRKFWDIEGVNIEF